MPSSSTSGKARKKKDEKKKIQVEEGWRGGGGYIADSFCLPSSILRHPKGNLPSSLQVCRCFQVAVCMSLSQ